MSKTKAEDVNPEELGPGQPREVDQPDRPPLRPAQQPAPKPATDHKEKQR